MIDVQMSALIFVFAFVYELLDSSLGQGYGTLGTPTFILIGLDPKAIVPAILLSQAVGGMVGAACHHRWRNADFSGFRNSDSRKVMFIVACGIVGVIVASAVGIGISKSLMSMYIGVMVLVIGVLLVSGATLRFTWKKLGVIGLISAFNKGLSGGGYGPLVTGGQAVIGVKAKSAVAVTDFAEAPICIVGFLVWKFIGGTPDMYITSPMCVGAALAPLVGAYITYRIPMEKFKYVLGIILLALGTLCLLRVLNP